MIIILNHPIMHQKKTQQKYPPKNILFCEKYSTIFNQIPPHVPRVPTLSLKIQYSNHHPLPPLLYIANFTIIFVFPPDCSRQGGMYQRGWGGLNRSKTDNHAQLISTPYAFDISCYAQKLSKHRSGPILHDFHLSEIKLICCCR